VHHREYAHILPYTKRGAGALQSLITTRCFGYDNCAQAILNADVFSNRPPRHDDRHGLRRNPYRGWMPPINSRYRRIFQKAFLPHMVGNGAKRC